MEESSNKSKEQKCDMVVKKPKKLNLSIKIKELGCDRCIFSGYAYEKEKFYCGKIRKDIASSIKESQACDSFLSNSEIWDQLNRKSDKEEKKRFPVKTTDTN